MPFTPSQKLSSISALRRVSLALIPVCLVGNPAGAQDASPAQPPAKPAPQNGGGQLGMFVNAMKKAPGCLGVDQAQVMGGRLALFGWFANKAQALAFTNGPVCGVLKRMTQLTPAEGDPLSDITDDKTPVLVVISFTPTQEKDVPSGLGQAAIEYWKPVSGGFAFAGRFAPEGVTVPGLQVAPKKDSPKPADGTAPATTAPDPANQQASAKGMGLDNLMPALQNSPGCLGAAAMKLEGGKLAIIAYFKDKKACLDWYYNSTHQKMMLSAPPPTRKPLEDVKDENAPVIAVATLTMSDKPNPDAGLPVSQIAVELYTPAKGGFARGGNFLPPPKPETAPK